MLPRLIEANADADDGSCTVFPIGPPPPTPPPPPPPNFGDADDGVNVPPFAILYAPFIIGILFHFVIGVFVINIFDAVNVGIIGSFVLVGGIIVGEAVSTVVFEGRRVAVLVLLA